MTVPLTLRSTKGSPLTHNEVDANWLALQAAVGVSLTDFYVSSDPDYSQAWIRFGTWARAQSVAGNGVELMIPPGLYPFNHGSCQFSLCGIKRLKIVGYGATVVNTFSGSDFGKEMAFFNAMQPVGNLTTGYQINNTVPGNTTVTLKTLADNSRFVVGDSMLVGSMDIQGYGAPLNVDRFDFVRITAIDTGTGVITFTPALRHYHRDDFADWYNTAMGKARVFPTDGTVTIAPEPSFKALFDVEHHYEGFEIRPTPAGHYPYMSTSGRLRTFTNMKLPALSESIAQRIRGDSCFFVGQGEPDKIVDSIEYDSCIWDSLYTLQSSSISRISFRNCRCPDMRAGTVKSYYAENCDFDSWISAALYGRGRSRVLVGCRIGSCGDFTPYPLAEYPALLSVNGTTVSYANGTFTQLKSAGLDIWNLTPGQACHWQVPFFGYSGDVGSFYVTKISDDATNIYIQTTCQSAATPAWAINGGVAKVRPDRDGNISFFGCYGGNDTRRISEATRAGERRGEYYKDIFMGSWTQSGYWYGRGGILKRIVFDVKQACAVVGARLDFGFTVRDATTLLDPLTLAVRVDLTLKGRRDFTLTAMTGKVGSDNVVLNSVVQTTLPANRINSGAVTDWFTQVLAPGSTPPYQMPIVEVEMYFDGGMYLRPLVAAAGHQGTFGTMANVTGTMFP